MLRKPLYTALAIQLMCTSAVNAGTKVMIKKGSPLPQSADAQLVQDYGLFKIYDMDATTAKQLKNGHIVDDMNMLLFESFRFDTQKSSHKYQFNKNSILTSGDGVQMIQFVGPIKQSWLDQVENQGGQLIHYIANNGYLVWVNDQSRQALNVMAAEKEILQFSAPYTESFKLGNTLKQQLKQSYGADDTVNVNIQLVDSTYNTQSKALIESLAQSINMPWSKVMNFHSVRVTMKIADLQQLAELRDTYWINEYFEITLNDEVQNQILAADFLPGNVGPAMTGYADFLSGLGFPTTPSSYPVVDVTDDGIGNGTALSGDPTFHEGGDLNNPSRLSYVANCTSAQTGEGVGGHGHLVTSIIGGFESRVGFPYVDPNGYIRTQGVNPYTRIAGTRIFNPGFDLSACGNTLQGLIKSVQDNGAHIMSNSWTCAACAGSYDDIAQAYDLGVRDADTDEAGSQPVIMVIGAGNDGPTAATVGSPGNGKNMITVGASENYRESDEDGPWTDGCGIGPTGADNAMDVIGFSSRGPSPGGRTKPEVVAPGTHIHGTASTSPNFDGTGVCDQSRPSGQSEIVAGSGTSFSTPAISGVASLAYYWLENPPMTYGGNFSTPSPAMMKAYLVAHPTYLTGVDANDDLPSNSQGYGMPNLQLMFDDTEKYLYDQDHLFDNTAEQWTWTGSAADPTKPVRIVMTYTDQPGALGISPQVNNLDLSVESGGNTYLGNVFSGEFSTTGGVPDTANNYEAVFFDAGDADDLMITVTATNIAGDGVPNTGDGTDQDFALVCYNCSQEPTFTLSTVQTELDVCSANTNDVVYGLNIGSVSGYTDPVTLSSVNIPANSQANFSDNPVTPVGSSDFTLSNLGSVVAGSYDFDINGVSGDIEKPLHLNLDLFDTTPDDSAVVIPIDGAVDVSTTGVTFEWAASTNATSYLFELSDVNDFSNLVDLTVTEVTTYTSVMTLNPGSQYFWRVTPNNACGPSANPVISSFTTAYEFCYATPTAIPDGNPAGLNINLNIPDTGPLLDMKVKVEATHTWVGDLIFTLTHDETNTEVSLMDRPGVPNTNWGCGEKHVDALFDDASGNIVEDMCNTPPDAAIQGDVNPEGTFADFIGENVNGNWTFLISDNADYDIGTLYKVCLLPTIVEDLIFEDDFE